MREGPYQQLLRRVKTDARDKGKTLEEIESIGAADCIPAPWEPNTERSEDSGCPPRDRLTARDPSS